MADVDAARRGRLVKLLWQLKQTCDEKRVRDVPFIHFNRLLHDPVYRSEVVTAASHSASASVSMIGRELATLDRGGSLLRRPQQASDYSRAYQQPGEQPAATARGRRAPGLGKTHQQQDPAWGWALRGALLTVAILAVAITLVWRDTLANLMTGRLEVSGSITEDTHWRAEQEIVLDGLVYVENNARLTIDPGTTVRGRSGSALIITRGAQIEARGSAAQPIVFTSAQPVGQRQRGDWGGLVLLGSAPVNRDNPFIEGIDERDPRGHFGGDDPEHHCGVLQYVRVEFAGFEVYTDNELNGITLGGCGRKTLIRYVQVHRGLDDGIEMFGGTVDLRNLVVTGARDDSVDWDMGWTGRVQFLVVQQHPDVGDNGFEADNWKQEPNAQPRSLPIFYNVSLIGGNSDQTSQRAMTLRRGSGGIFRNFVVTGFSKEAVDLRGDAVARLVETGQLSFEHMLFFNVGDGFRFFSEEVGEKDDDAGFDEAAYFMAPARNNRFNVEPKLSPQVFNIINPDFTPLQDSPVRDAGIKPPQGEFWDEAASYLGAVRPGAVTSWLDGWTSYPAS